MYDNITGKNEETEIDLSRLMRALLNKAWLIGVVAVICAVVTFWGTYFFVTPQYQSAAMFYVNNSSVPQNQNSSSISSSDISASKSLVDTYIVILNTRETFRDVMDYAGVALDYDEIQEMVFAEVVDSTQVFQVTVTGPDAVEVQKIADAISHILPKRISSIMEGTSAQVVDFAVIPSRPSSPNYIMNTVIGFLAGLMGAVGIIVLRELFNVTICTEEDIERSCKYPVLTAVPDMVVLSKYAYGYGKKTPGEKQSTENVKDPDVIGRGIHFAASEAYKLLRTKILFSFTDEKECHVIGISSALIGEGKSVSAINMAYSLSQVDKRVLLIDCDMRCPSLEAKLPIRKASGLSDFLAGRISIDNLAQMCGMSGEEDAFYVVTAGSSVPNPMELLSSGGMEKLLEQLKQSYDYIILDLPPVGEVGDALAVTRFIDGMLLVVRQNHCNRIALRDTARQFDFMGAKVLGVVYNCVSENSATYGMKYNSTYENSYSTAFKRK